VIGGTAALELADWRRQVAELYAEVRQVARRDPEAAHLVWRRRRELLYRGHPQSPVPEAERRTFGAVHFDYDPVFRFEVRPETVEDPATHESLPAVAVRSPALAEPAATGNPAIIDAPMPLLPVSAGDARTFDRVAWVSVPFPSGARRLAIYWLREYSGGLFLPFTDATSGRETYGAGRYLLDTAKGADLGPGLEPATIVLDFNFAYQPSCAFDPRWACPLAPAENRLDLEVRAGERIG
jgi:uncharacterized protein (DUF1684 family)